MLINPDVEAELRAIIRSEVNDVVGAHFRDAFGALMSTGMEPLLTGMAQLLNFRQRLVTMEESLGVLVESQARVERAVADATGTGDDNEPWRESLRDDDVVLDDES